MVLSKIKKLKEEDGKLFFSLPLEFLKELGWKKDTKVEYKIKDKNTVKAIETEKEKPNVRPLFTLKNEGKIKIIFPVTLGYALDFVDKDLQFKTDKNELTIKKSVK